MKTDIYHGDVNLEEKHTVAGRLKQFTDSDSAAMQYASALGRRQAGARGLTNSSIAVGQAAEQVFRVGTDVAKADAALISQQRIATGQNRTQLETQRASDAAAFDRTKLTTDTQKDIQKASDQAAYDRTKLTTDTQVKIQTQGDKAAAERLASQITSQEKIADLQSQTQKDIQSAADSAALARLSTQISSNEAIALAERANAMAIANVQSASALAVAQERSSSAETIAAAQITSAENLNAANIQSAEDIADARNATNITISANNAAAIAAENALDRLSSENITNWNNQAQMDLQALRENFALTSEYRSDATNAWTAFSNGIANIDTTASAASQTEQYNRLQGAFQSQMTYINKTRLNDLVSKGLSATDTEAMEAYEKASQLGLSADELDALAGAPAGTASAWVTNKGLQPLTGNTEDNSGTTTTTTTTTSTDNSGGTDADIYGGGTDGQIDLSETVTQVA